MTSDDVEMLAALEAYRNAQIGGQQDAMRAAIECLRSRGWQKVPDGYVVVPKEPTEAMLEQCFEEFKRDYDPPVTAIYRAMLSTIKKEK